jgi:putative oxidoreductase
MLDERTAPYGALLLRVLLGFLFWAHLYWKFFVLPGGLCSLGFAGEPARNARG